MSMAQQTATDDGRTTTETRFTVLTVIPYSDGPQYREYYVDSDELPAMLQSMENPQFAEKVIDVSKGVDIDD